jgi:hypothetical protein
MSIEIIEGNKLICEFMGLVGYNEKGNPNEYGYYHSQWEQLMPVVEKIESLDSRGIDCRITIVKDTCDIYYDNKERQYEFNLWADGSKIKAVWQSIIAFITWYNSQNK